MGRVVYPEGPPQAAAEGLDCGVKLLKDIAFERAIEGELVPVFSAGKLMGYRRKRNDALLIFCLRHYGEDRAGRRTTVNYFSTRVSAGAGVAAGGEDAAGAAAEASTTTVRTVISGGGEAADPEAAQALLAQFEGVELDDEARAAILAALHECAARSRELDAGKEAGLETAMDAHADDPDEPFVALPERALPHRYTLEPPTTYEEVVTPEGEDHWPMLGEDKPEALVRFEEEQAAKQARRKAGGRKR